MSQLKNISIQILTIGILFFSGLYVGIAAFIGFRVNVDTKVPSDAIVVLGAASYKGDLYNPCLVSRIDHALNLQQKGLAPILIFSGGDDTYTRINESKTMRTIALEHGASDASILLESYAKSTYENIDFSRRIMRQYNLQNLIIVTEPFHSPRAGLIANHLGISHSLSPAVNSPCWIKWKYLSRYFLREPIAIMYYFLTGKL